MMPHESRMTNRDVAHRAASIRGVVLKKQRAILSTNAHNTRRLLVTLLARLTGKASQGDRPH